MTLASLRGRVVLLDFWATWCKPCVKAMPKLDALHKEFGEGGLAVVGVSIDQGDDGSKKVQKFLKKNPVAYTIVMDSASPASWESFNVAALPTLYLIDRDGRALQRWTGVIDMDVVRAQVERALARSEN